MWIKCKDELPKHLESVIFLYKDKKGSEVLTGWYDHDNKEWAQTAVGFLTGSAFFDFSDDLHHKKKYITHWMPLPEAPKE
jgi:hypothetical protein